MLEIRRGSFGYYVECDECAVVLEVTHEDLDNMSIVCENCGQTWKIDIGYDEEDSEDASEE